MASACSGGALQLDSIPVVDLRLFSPAELYSLSVCSSSAYDPRRCDDVVIPKIDRSVFNESAGSRKQTYFRLRLAPPSSSSSAASPFTSTSVAATTSGSDFDRDNEENVQIVNLLKQLFVPDMNPSELLPVKIDYSGAQPPDQSSSPPAAPSPCIPNKKRKRERTPSTDAKAAKQRSGRSWKTNDRTSDPLMNPEEATYESFSLLAISVRRKMEEIDREILNSDGVAVDLAALGSVQHPYEEQIRLSTASLVTKEDFQNFLQGLDGQWRKRKKIVNASEFGSALPVGWKLLLSVKKMAGQLRICCSRYISPSGLYFVSCKGVSSYLCCLHGIKDAQAYEPTLHNEIIHDADNNNKLAASSPAIPAEENPVFPSDSDYNNHGIEVETGRAPPDSEPLQVREEKVVVHNEPNESCLHDYNKFRNGNEMCVMTDYGDGDGPVIPTWNDGQKNVLKMDGYVSAAALMSELEDEISERRVSKNAVLQSEGYFGSGGMLSSNRDQKYEEADNKMMLMRKTYMKQNEEAGALFRGGGFSHGGYLFDPVYAKQNEAAERNGKQPDGNTRSIISFGDLHQTVSGGDGFNIQPSSSSVPDDLKLGMSYAFDFMRQHEEEDHGHSFDILQPQGEDHQHHQKQLFGDGNVSLRSGYENHLKVPFPASAHQVPPPPSSSRFHSFGITIDQVEKESHGQMMRQGNNNNEPPVEYSFMGEHSSSTSHGGEPNIFPPQPQPQQPLFWLRKDIVGSTPPPPPPPTHRHHHHQNNMQLVASVCAWCRNLFLHEPVLLGTETAMCCPSCRSRIPGHFNLL